MVELQGYDLNDLAEERVTADFFNSSAEDIAIDSDSVTLYGPWCVEEGLAIDFSCQVTLEGRANGVELWLTKNGVIVAKA